MFTTQCHRARPISARRWIAIAAFAGMLGLLATAPTATAQTGLLGAEVLNRPGAPTGADANPPTITPDPSVAAQDQPHGGRCIQMLGSAFPLRCDVGDLQSHTVIDLVGDSHTSQWLSGFQRAANEHHWHVRIYAKLSCPFNMQPIELAGKPATLCTRWNTAVRNDVLQQHPTLVVTTAKPYQVMKGGQVLSETDSIPPLTSGYRRLWDRLNAAGIPVAALDDTPVPNFDLVGCVEAHRHDLLRCTGARADFYPGATALLRAASTDANVSRLHFNDFVCPWARCAAVIGDVLIWRDNHHLTATYARTAHRQIGNRVAALLAGLRR
jgi:hypothetical protein